MKWRIAIVGVALVVAGCGGDEEPAAGPAERPAVDAPAERPAAERPAAEPLEPLRCPAAAENCAAAAGEITYVEAVDPDGDGDAHFVLLSDESVTGPGIAVVDVAVDMRPRPLPRPGDWLSAVGPVYRGSYGQRQIEATEIRVSRR